MRLLEQRPARVHFQCECGRGLDFLALDRVGECVGVTCATCGRIWEQRLQVEENERGWTRSLRKGPTASSRSSARVKLRASTAGSRRARPEA